jgi:nitrate/nitrite-specific signal transduction histidine kinase
MRWGITGCITALLLGMASMGWAQGPGFAQEDRDRLIRLEASLQVFMEQVDKRFEQIDKRFEQVDKRITELREDMNKRFEQVDKRFEQVDKRITELREDMNKRFEELITFMWILAGVFTALTVAVIGFAYWDRRTIIRRAKLETIEELEERGKLRALLEAMRAVAAKDSTMADALRRFNLL